MRHAWGGAHAKILRGPDLGGAPRCAAAGLLDDDGRPKQPALRIPPPPRLSSIPSAQNLSGLSPRPSGAHSSRAGEGGGRADRDSLSHRETPRERDRDRDRHRDRDRDRDTHPERDRDRDPIRERDRDRDRALKKRAAPAPIASETPKKQALAAPKPSSASAPKANSAGAAGAAADSTDVIQRVTALNDLCEHLATACHLFSSTHMQEMMFANVK